MNIKDVQVVELKVNADDRGYFYEVMHSTDSFFNKFGQIYVVCDPTRGTVRAFHKHEILWDWFCIVHGSAKFVLVDDRQDKSTYRQKDVIVIGEHNPSLIVVPPGIFHGWMSLEDDTIMVSTASEVYNRAKPDEIRISPDSFGEVWQIKGR